MVTFLGELIKTIITTEKNLSKITFVLPSKRACFFLKKELVFQNQETQFSPNLFSIEDFASTVSDLKILDKTQLLFELFESYNTLGLNHENESIEQFAGWAPTLLSDFNELDSYRIEQKRFFDYLSNIKEMDHWYLKDEKTNLIKNYIRFWNSLPILYEHFVNKITAKGYAYQGLVYREAAGNIEHYIQANPSQKYVFIGFNALNTCEQHILQELLETGNTKIFWDADGHFANLEQHSASFFMNQFQKQWKWYRKNDFQTINNNYAKEKNISTYGASKNIGQIKLIANILSTLTEETIQNTAVILADENLILPMLNALPRNIKEVNITMGLALDKMPVTHFFEKLLKIQSQNSDTFYHKEISQLMSHPLGQIIMPVAGKKILAQLIQSNKVYISIEELLEITKADQEQKEVELLFSSWKDNPKTALKQIKEVAIYIKSKITHSPNPALRTALHKNFLIFQQLESLIVKYPYITSITSLLKFYKETVSTTTLDFEGEPQKGLQIMGLLETRALDYETVIIASVNEGILPAGKSNNSYIPYELKKEYALPTFKEKDAVYTYHFYRLLHRAKKVHLLYNNLSEGINSGEKSRLIYQIQYENLPQHNITNYTVSPHFEVAEKHKKEITKTPEVLEKLKKLATNGLSPSAITTYIRNPFDFYIRYVLGIDETDSVEETIEANTLGTIIHNSLEKLYKPYVGEILSKEIIPLLQSNVNTVVAEQFQDVYKSGDISFGKNLIIFEVAKRCVANFLNLEKTSLKEQKKLIIKQVEQNIEAVFPVTELPFQIKIKGMVDRVDIFENMLRIIDYKTGKVEARDLKISSWEELALDYKYSKAFQVLTYAWIWQQNNPFQEAMAGVVSFKNLGSGFIPFEDSGKKSAIVTAGTIEEFSVVLRKLILEIFDPNIPFIEKEV